jgi:hypothetical protein
LLKVSTKTRVFEHAHAREIQRAKDDASWANRLETIVHPNEYFKRSYLLRNLDKGDSTGGTTGEVKKEEEGGSGSGREQAMVKEDDVMEE